MPPVILAVAEIADDAPTRLSLEVATLARQLAEASGGQAVGLVIDAAPDAPAAALAAYLPRVVAVAAPAVAGEVWAPHAAAEVRRLADEGLTHVLLGATADGRDLAGLLVGATGWGLLANATGVTWADGGPVAEASVLGGKAITTSRLTGPAGIVTVRLNAVTASPAATAGSVETRDPAGAATTAAAVLERVEEAGAEASLEEARIVVVGGRGVGGPEGFGIVEQLAAELGGVVGATRASVDAGWVPYARQIGQTGKAVKPALYLGLGVSGAMQHRVGMQGADAIVAVNKDPDAPIGEVADLLVIGDLFEVGPALLAEIRARRGA
ncbi:MAG TPA: electron transfer flavoprotein subunit alpha/FixB family protein [Candidatus Limnocylindrales bacterium]|nr:electron transfer flavoprotein subunit alpha/FixB family protein [Candidatus Limnocylindrales bacterium]